MLAFIFSAFRSLSFSFFRVPGRLDYLRDPVYGVSGSDGFGRYFMRQVMPDGRILSRELTSWKDCVESDPIEPLGSTELND